MKISAEEFVKVWQSSSSVSEVSRKFGITSNNVTRNKAAKLRQQGVHLQRFIGGGNPKRLDIPRLNEIAKEYAKHERRSGI